MADSTSLTTVPSAGSGSPPAEPPILVADRGLRLVWVNQSFEALLGHAPGALAGRTLGEITHADDLAIGLDLIRRAFDGDLDRYPLEKRYLRADGTAVPVRVEVEMLDDPKLGALAVGTVHPIPPSTPLPVDVTDALVRQVREEQHVLALVHEAGVIADDASTRAELLERTLRVLCIETGSSFAIANDCRNEDRPVVEAEVRIEDESSVGAPVRAGVPCMTRWIRIPISSGDSVTGVIELFSTSWVDAGDSLIAALSDVGAHLGRALERVRLETDTIELAAAERSFAATATHELRNPVAAAALALSTLERRGERLQQADRDALFSVVDRSLAQLGGVVTGLGELARADGAVSDEPLVDAELAPLIVGACEDLELVLEHHVAVDVPDGITARGNPVAITEIIGNLVTNAVRHGGPTITVTARRDEAGTVRVEVADDGPGVTDSVEARLFEPFARGGNRSEGLGLGLAISRRLALAMGGTLSYRAVEPHGARFVLTLREAT